MRIFFLYFESHVIDLMWVKRGFEINELNNGYLENDFIKKNGIK